MPPARTSSVTLFSRSTARPAAAAPMRHQACGTPRTVSGSAAPSMREHENISSGRPAALDKTQRQAAAPATMPSLPAIRLFRLADSPAQIRANEIDDVVDRGDAAETFGGLVHPVA